MSIIIASEKLKYYEHVCSMCASAGYSESWKDKFWKDLLANKGVYRELLYYFEHNDFLEKYKVDGYTVLDIFIWQMRKYNVRVDMGKNGPECDKTAMLLETFRAMLDMTQKGAKVEWSMEMNNGMDEM